MHLKKGASPVNLMNIVSAANSNVRIVCRIAQREALDLLRDRRLAIVAASVVLLLSVSVWIGAQRYIANQKQQEMLSGGERERWLTQGDRGQRTQQLRVFRLVPLGGETIGWKVVA